jgi:hypothetical protein
VVDSHIRMALPVVDRFPFTGGGRGDPASIARCAMNIKKLIGKGQGWHSGWGGFNILNQYCRDFPGSALVGNCKRKLAWESFVYIDDDWHWDWDTYCCPYQNKGNTGRK